MEVLSKSAGYGEKDDCGLLVLLFRGKEDTEREKKKAELLI